MFILDRITSLFKLGRGFFSLVLCVAISFALMTLNTSEKALFYQVAMATVLSPVNSVLNVKQKYFSLSKQNEILRKANTQLKTENDKLTQYKLQNARMREMLGFREQSGYSLISGEIIGRNPGRFEFSWMLNLGKKDSITLNMPVLTAKGVVGKIAKVFNNSSVVQLLHDPNCKVSVIVQRSRVVGIMESFQMGSLIARFPAHSDVVYGDTLVTSGMGGVFPKGLSLGVVVEENLQSTEILKGVEVTEFQSSEDVEEAFILKSKPTWVLGAAE